MSEASIIFRSSELSMTTQKKGIRLVMFLSYEDNDKEQSIAALSPFTCSPVEFRMRKDLKKIEQLESYISEQQRKAIYKLIADIGEHLGYNAENAKEVLKTEYMQDLHYTEFSLSDCSKEQATEFIHWLIDFGMSQGVNMSDWNATEFDKMCELSVKYKQCIVCGNDADIHHINSIGMGRDRRKVDDSNYRTIGLCRIHHSELHQIGYEKFADKYKLPIVK